MRCTQSIALSTLGMLLAGCSTTSFAPPVVSLDTKMTVKSDSKLSCRNNIRAADSPNAIGDTAAGARALIDNFIYVYRCRAHEAANGRQGFEVPALLTAAGGTLAAAFGAGPNAAIGTGGASAIFTHGNSYYDPKTKAAIYDHALDALLCIKTESVGVTAYVDTSGDPLKSAPALTGGGTISVPAETRYHDMVVAALFSVERILSQRLSNAGAGAADPAGIIAEINDVKKKVDDAEAKKAAELVARTGTKAPDSSLYALVTTPGYVMTQTDTQNMIATAEVTKSELFDLDLDLLQPKLQQCVLRAKV